jgi:hypothetical protein
MKKSLLFLGLLASTIFFSQSRYEIGYKEGYYAGCKYVGSTENCQILAAPLPSLSQNRNSYQNGYQNGYQDGMKKGNSNSGSYERKPRVYGEYQSIDVNAIAKSMYLQKQAEAQYDAYYYHKIDELNRVRSESASSALKDYTDTNNQISDLFVALYKKYETMASFEKAIDDFKAENENIYSRYKNNGKKFSKEMSLLRIKIIDYEMEMLYDIKPKEKK